MCSARSVEGLSRSRPAASYAKSSPWPVRPSGKVGETSWDGFSVGDDVLVRTVSGQLDRAWANLTRKRGLVVSGGSDRLTIALDKSGDDQLDVAVTPATIFQNDFTGQRVWSELPPETSLDVIGLEAPGGLIASLIGYGLPGADPQTGPSEPSVTVTQTSGASPDVMYCTYTYNHFASWFPCATGHGACGTCNTSNDSQCAWPAQDVCGCCGANGCGCDCVVNCLTLAIAGCGHHVQVTDACSGKYHDTVIADCGPCMSTCNCPTNVCNHTCSLCGKSRTHPIVDLTKPTFAVFRNPNNYGCFPAQVAVTIPC